MTERSFAEFLRALETEGAQAADDEQALLHANIGLTTPHFSPQQLASSAARIARQLAQAQQARRQRDAGEPGMATVVAAPEPAARPVESLPAPRAQRRKKYCRRCGDELQPDKRFCTRCGDPLG